MDTSSEAKTVLIADETPFSRQMLSYLLAEEGHEVLVADNAEEAGVILAREGSSVDLVILDLEPAEDGALELPGPLYPGGAAERVPLLVITGAHSATAARDARIDATVQRTVSTERILFMVNRLLYPQDDATRDNGRQLVRFPATYHLGDERVLARAFNLSRGGAFLEVEDDALPPVGTSLPIRFEPPDREPLEIVGEVMWHNTGVRLQRSHPQGIGVRFKEATEALDRFLAASPSE